MPTDAEVDLGFWLAEDDARTVPPRCDYLFHRNERFAADTEVLPHSHQFWQLEVVTTGRLCFRVDEEEHLLRQGMGVLAPQQRTHAIRYLDEPTEALTVKFHVAGDPARVRPGGVCLAGIEVGAILQALAANLPGDGDCETSPPPRVATANALLAAILTRARAQDEVAPPHVGSDLVARVKESILKQAGQAVAVKELAAELDLSPSHLAARFRRETGVGLKHWIDQQRCIFAARQLTFTDAAIGDVAATLAFADGFTFSRFFRRVVGLPPSDFRKLAWEQLREG